MQSTQSIPRGFTGTISLGLTDLIQMVCLSRSDLVIGVTSSNGKASIHIRQGQIQHAQTELLTGAEAFFEVARWHDGQFEILPYENNVPGSVNKPWEHLLLEAIRLQDEKRIDGEQAGYVQKPGPEILEGIDDILGDLLESGNPAARPERQKSIGSPAPRPPVKVLIVEDSTFFSKKLRKMLESDGSIEVVGLARNGKEALEFLGSGKTVDVITLDANMPVMPGNTALKHIMIQHRIPVIIISAQQQDSMHRILDFLQLGAVDYVAKPTIHDDPVSYALDLTKLVNGAAKARVALFRRLRTPDYSGELITAKPAGAAKRKTLVITGAEGAHMDWLRLPLRQLCGNGLVIGLQKLECGLAPEFARLIRGKTGVETEYLSAAHRIAPGKLYLSDVRRKAGFRPGPDGEIEVEVDGSTALNWENGLEFWLERIADRAGGALCVYYMSGAGPAPESLLTKLFDRGIIQILAPLQSVVCSGMIDSIEPYAVHCPGLVLNSNPEALTEVLET